jgi:hypothetical protein
VAIRVPQLRERVEIEGGESEREERESDRERY